MCDWGHIKGWGDITEYSYLLEGGKEHLSYKEQAMNKFGLELFHEQFLIVMNFILANLTLIH